MVTEKEVERYKEMLDRVDFTTNLENKWHELIADLLIEIRDKLDEINKKLEKEQNNFGQVKTNPTHYVFVGGEKEKFHLKRQKYPLNSNLYDLIVFAP